MKNYKLNPPPRYDQEFFEALDKLNSYEFWVGDSVIQKKGLMVKKYKVHLDQFDWPHKVFAEMREDQENGEWVKWEDVVRDLTRLRGLVEQEAYAEPRTGEHWVMEEVNSIFEEYGVTS